MKGFYNPDDNKIYNCKKGSKTYLHEYRHKQQYKVAGWVLRKFDFLRHTLAYFISILFVTIYFIDSGIITLIASYAFILFVKLTIIDLALEFDAQIYAELKYGKKNNTN